MLVEIIVPDLGESVAEATVGHWHKAEGDLVAVGDVLVVLETAKVTLEVGAQASGKLASITAHEGDDVQQGEVLGTIEEVSIPEQVGDQVKGGEQGAHPEYETTSKRNQPAHADGNDQNISPLARRIATEHDVDLNRVEGSGPNQRITRDDVDRYLESRQPSQVAQTSEPPKADEPTRPKPELMHRDVREERVRMTRRRRTIASRLVEAQQATAMLTTFNDVDMSAVLGLRYRRKEQFQEKYSVKLGLTSFFIKAAVGALKTFPRLNAEIDGTHIILKHYYDIGVAIGDPEGLIVPVIRDAGRKSFAEIEMDIRSFARAAEAGTISVQDLQGGTFTVTNGGIFGSLLSTPILNPPQVGILGLHRIEDRPVAVEGQVAIRPMMYLALSYDHRMVDGREAVQFLAHIKQLIEEPERLLLES